MATRTQSGTGGDANAAAAFPDLRIVTGAAFELIAELGAFTSGPARGSLESGKAWIREVRTLAGPELIERVERFGFGVYVELATAALEAGEPRGVEELLRAIDALTPDVFRRRLLGADSAMTRSMVGDGVFDRAIAGDPSARSEILAAFGPYRAARQAVERVLGSPAAELQAEVRGIVADWGARVFAPRAAVALAAIEREAAARSEQLAAGTAQEVLATATRGVAYDPPAWIRAIVIVPTVAMRPYLIPIELGETVVFVYSVGDEAFESDPAAPPQRLVKVAAALGDERRLRILHLLRGEQLTAT
jgi:hypothetical protein